MNEISKSLSRALVLIALFAIGAGLIWHIGTNLVSAGHNSLPPAAAVQESQIRPAGLPAIPTATPSSRPEDLKPALPAGPDPQIVTTNRGRFIATEPILFNSGASTLRETSGPKLDRIAAFLIRNPDVTLEIIGHTDNLGPEPVNQKVSAERASIVMDYLVSQGIDPSRLRSRGMGSMDPIESNDTQLGRQANRRIEFLIKEMRH